MGKLPDGRQRVLITGGAGFIGSHLADSLLQLGYPVTIIDDLSTGRFENIEHLVSHPNFCFTIDTINNEIVMDRLASECDMIIHLAAAVGVMLIVEQPVHTIKTNIMGTEAVLNAAVRYRAKVLIASTSEVYGKGNRVPFQEEDDVVIGPTSRNRWAYAASKMVDEFLALAYHHEKDLPVVIFRLFNTVGTRQTGRYGMVIPRFVQQALRGEPVTVYGDGAQTRCFLHVSDAVKAIIALSNCPAAVGKVFNVGSTEEISIQRLAGLVLDRIKARNSSGELSFLKETENKSKIVNIPYEKAYAVGFEDLTRRVPNTEKIAHFTGWQPRYNLEETLDDIITYLAEKENVENSTTG
ncbi:MAG: GDP-mannose 4,6-dehydratase [Anaerolineales bacterium]|nr:GDP-mannose 4,6-dehydratase [Anaerolineales bacterium]